MDHNVLYQFSDLRTFNNKGYDGELTQKGLKKYGDTGLGTFNGLDGELMLLGGEVYQADGDCKIKTTEYSAMIPFAAMGFLSEAKALSIKDRLTMAAASQVFDALIGHEDPIVLAVIEGDFANLTLHSVWPQTKPYRSLKTIVSEQKVVGLENQHGRMVAIRCPQSALGQNVVGWHFHYLSKDLKIGGHVNDFDCLNLDIGYSIKSQIIKLSFNS